MTKSEVPILIVDDSRDRDDIYRKFFSSLSRENDSEYTIKPLIPKTPNEALSILRSRGAALVVLDMVLETEWLNSAVLIYETIKKQKYAVALVSANFDDSKRALNTASVLVALASVPKLGFIPYTEGIERFFGSSRVSYGRQAC